MQYYDEHGRPIQTSNHSGLSIASMVLGIVAVVFCCFWPLSLVLGIIGLVLAFASKIGRKLDAFAITGLATSCVAVVLALVMYLVPLLVVRDATRNIRFNFNTEQQDSPKQNIFDFFKEFEKNN